MPVPPLPQALREVVARQCGVLGRAQALATGVSAEHLEAQVCARRWKRALPGVYATFTGALGWEARCWAVLLYSGDGAVLSHATAAALYGFGDVGRLPLHVTVPHARRVEPRPQVTVHRCRHLDLRRHPTLSPPRTRAEDTVLDLVDTASTPDEALAVVARAGQRLASLPARLPVAMEARTRLRWRSEVAAAVADVSSGAHSALELHYLRRVERRHRLPEGRRQRPSVRQGVRRRTDVAYEDQGVLVELDGRLGHEGVDGRWRDARRDNAASLAGERTLRYGWRDVVGSPCEVARQVGALLQLGGWTGSPRPCGRVCLVGR